MSRFLLLTVLIVSAFTLAAQPRRVDAFGQVGWMRWAGDEGSLGGSAAYGGAVMIPLNRRWAVDVDVLTSVKRTDYEPDQYFRTRRTTLTPAVVARWGTDRVYGFVGGGVGGQWDAIQFRRAPIVGLPQSFDRTDTNFIYLLGKGGLVAVVTGRFLIRADLMLNFPFVLPNAVVRIGAGWRF